MRTFRLRARSRRYAQTIAVLAAVVIVAAVAVSSYGASSAAHLRPSAPAKVTVVPHSKSALVRWTVPTITHGSKITRYRVTPYLGKVAKSQKVVGAVTHTTITGLKNGSKYSFRVVAVNAHGAGPARSSALVKIGSLANSVHAVPAVPLPSTTVPTTTKPTTPKPATPKPTTTTTKPAPAPAPAPPAPSAPCVGVALTNGQTTINAYGPNTTFCLSGTHNWSLTPKTGDQLIGPAVLDGGSTTQYAVQPATSTNVVLSGLEIRNYNPSYQQAAIMSNQSSTSWVLQNLQVHDNGNSSGGSAVAVGPSWQILGGRYYNNRQKGLTDALGPNATIDGAEIDHNNFTNDAYTAATVACDNDAGGFKWVVDNVTVKNSKIHDNACVGLWMDINSHNATITNNQVYNNWAEGIFVEISHGASITGNYVYGNGFRSFRGSCANIWMYGGGITINSSDTITVANNSVSGNCNGITATQENRAGAVLQNIYVHDNTVSGPGGKTGAAAYPVSIANLLTRNIVFANNTSNNGMNLCLLSC
jgi:parallel beta-helix repeat protein